MGCRAAAARLELWRGVGRLGNRRPPPDLRLLFERRPSLLHSCPRECSLIQCRNRRMPHPRTSGIPGRVGHFQRCP
eukprot:7714024-Pyramimonas_sp.AAC.1